MEAYQGNREFAKINVLNAFFTMKLLQIQAVRPKVE